MITVVSQPQRNINDDPAIPSRWSAVHQPIQFAMRRTDIDVAIITSGTGGNVRINVNDPITGASVGTNLFINSGSYFGTYEITNNHSTIPRWIEIDLPYTSFAVGGYINLLSRENYYVETEIYGVDTSGTFTYYKLGTSINKPDDEGNVIVDVASWLKSLVAYNETFSFDVLNKKDETLGGMYNIKYREVYNGVAQAFSAMSSTLVNYYVNSAKQIQQRYGQNMADYVPALIQLNQKFMSDFEKPTYFAGYPFALTFIYSDLITGYEVFKLESTKDLNGTEIANNYYELDNAQSQRVNRLMLEEGYSPNVNEVDVWLEFGEVKCQTYAEDEYVVDGYVEEHCGVATVEPPDVE